MLHVSARADAALGQANAPVKSHWSFQKPSEPAVPGVRDGAWPRSEVDRFLLAKLEAESGRLPQKAFRYVLGDDRVSTVANGPSTIAHIEEMAAADEKKKAKEEKMKAKKKAHLR